MKDRKTLTKINTTKKSKNKNKLRNTAPEMISLKTDTVLTKYNEIIHGTAKVMTKI